VIVWIPSPPSIATTVPTIDGDAGTILSRTFMWCAANSFA
jgi:hypothetical protein